MSLPMKSYLAGLLFLLVLTSCTSKNEVKVPKFTEFDLDVAGTISGSDTLLENTNSIAKKWSAAAMSLLHSKDTIVLQEFRIVKTMTVGSVKKECYLLMANNQDGTVKVGTTLHLENDKFFFDVDGSAEKKTSRIIVCEGSCNELGCLPQVVINEGEVHLVCSSCVECEKFTRQLY